MPITQTLPDGLQHGLINTVANSVPDDGFKRFAEKDRAKMEKLKKEDERPVKCQYLNKDGPNERLERPYMRWAGQPITTWRFIHGHVYEEVPNGLIQEVNAQAKLAKKRSDLMGTNGQPLVMDVPDDPQHRFVPVEF